VIRAQPAEPANRSVAADIAAAAQLACLLEASAPKPGNVSPGRHFADARYEDFLASAAAIGEPLSGVGTRPIGATIRLAIEATVRWTRSNTNLGIVLLLTPLARAAHEKGVGSRFSGRGEKTPDPFFVRRVLAGTTVDDARDVYGAIRLASPGGLGRVDDQDIAGEPTATLLDVMKLAAARDAVAREYATGFEITFDIGAPALERARAAGLEWDNAVVETFLTLLAANADTHVVRRAGESLAADIVRRAAEALAAGGVRSEAGRRAIGDLDRHLRSADNTGNPGTTADLTAAAIFVVLLGGGWTREP
jgi:triphosphoribosyl-dephospho-CoA synthase